MQTNQRTRIHRAPLAALSLAGLLLLAAGSSADIVRWQSGSIDIQPQSRASLTRNLTALTVRAESSHVVVQFNQPLDTTLRAELADRGLRVLSSLGGTTYFASLAGGKVDVEGLAGSGVLNEVLDVQLDWKLHRSFRAGEVPFWSVVSGLKGLEQAELEDLQLRRQIAAEQDNPTVAAYVMFHGDVQLEGEADLLAARHGARVRDYLETINALVIELPYDQVRTLAACDEVQWLEPPLPRFDELNNSNRELTEVETVWDPPYGLDGSGVKVLVYDGAYAYANHADFQGRLTVRDNSGLGDHATHVSGTIGGAGISNPLYKGMAPGVTIESYGFEWDSSGVFLYDNPGDLEADYNQAINTYDCVISNNSIGTNTSSYWDCEITGDYGITSNLIDSIVRGGLGEPFRVVWANGNERQTDRCYGSDGMPGEYYSTAPPACAKNHITVGALNSNDDSVTSFTSWGPTDDGRIKPDISTAGCQSNDDGGVTSCSSSGGYSNKCGTSMASPTACGLSALIMQDFRQQFPGEPDFRNSTLKVLLANSAYDNGNPGPDMQYGFGSLRAPAAIDLVRSGNFFEATLDQDQSYAFLVLVDPDTPQLRVTMAWDDVPAQPNVLNALINDLDIRITDPGGSVHYPWTLDPANPGNPAVRTQEDHLNNIEEVAIDNPVAGAYRVEVFGYSVPQGPQPFSVAASSDIVNCSSAGIAQLGGVKFACEATANLRVVDCDLNTSDTVTDTVDVMVYSDSEPAGEMVTLFEDDPASASFGGSIAISETDGLGVILVGHGDVLTLEYIDADDGDGNTNVQVLATADIDCQPPVISNVQVVDIGPRNATITFSTDEPARAVIDYGTSCGNLNDQAIGNGYQTSHSIELSGLQDQQAYFFVITTEDQAANAAYDDNDGNCHTFETPDIPDFFTEHWDNDFDLENKVVTLEPSDGVDGYIGCIEPITELPTDPAGGTVILNGFNDDDAYALVQVDGGNTVALYDATYTSFYVGSNGYITFEQGDTTYSESYSDHYAYKRIAALFDDLNPEDGGTISYKRLSDRIVSTWDDVPEWGGNNSNTFQIELYYDGAIRIAWLGIDAGDGIIVGLSKGAGIPPDFVESDFSALGDCIQDIPGDFNGDGCVDQSDLGHLLSAYGQSDAGDIDGDGDTDQADLGELLAHYLEGC